MKVLVAWEFKSYMVLMTMNMSYRNHVKRYKPKNRCTIYFTILTLYVLVRIHNPVLQLISDLSIM
jgi:hypothetical protein